MSDVLLLDVGHGNCTIVYDEGAVAVIDAPAGSALLETLDGLGVTHVDYAIVSHADADHIQGILALLTSDEITVGRLLLNPDRDRTSSVWTDLKQAVSIARRTETFRTTPSLTTDTEALSVGGITMTVVAPSEALALAAPRGSAPGGRVTTANTLSAVIKVERYPDLGVLLAGDLDGVGLEDLKTSNMKVKASALVFPHHGGLPGSTPPKAFGQALLELVQPSHVYVSNGRNKHSNPRAEIVESILDHGCSLTCTQLAQACGEPSSLEHLENWPAAGRDEGHSCGGTISLTLGEDGVARDAGWETSFRFYVETRVPTPMCKRTKH